jgi:hypothetical protein
VSARALDAQREQLRRELQAHRAVIAQQLGPAPEAPRAFPRSHTLRVLAHRPLQAIRLLVGIIALVRGR